MSTNLKIILLLWKCSRGTLLCPQDFGVSVFFHFLVFNCFLFYFKILKYFLFLFLIIIIFNLIIFFLFLIIIIFNYIYLLFCKILSGYIIVSLCQDTQLCLIFFVVQIFFIFF